VDLGYSDNTGILYGITRTGYCDCIWKQFGDFGISPGKNRWFVMWKFCRGRKKSRIALSNTRMVLKIMKTFLRAIKRSSGFFGII
jgi:hypothetical protein